MLYHPGGYGGTARAECVLANGAALATDWRQDNSGPHSAAEVRAVYKAVAAEFKNATVFASTFDRFVYSWPGPFLSLAGLYCTRFAVARGAPCRCGRAASGARFALCLGHRPVH